MYLEINEVALTHVLHIHTHDHIINVYTYYMHVPDVSVHKAFTEHKQLS